LEETVVNPGEAVIACIELTPVLKLDMPYVGVEKGREITGVNKEITSLARQLVMNELPKKLKMPRPWTYEQLVKRFSSPLTESDLEYITGRFGEETHGIVSDFLATLQITFAHLSSELPVGEYQTYNGPKQIKPSSDKIWEWYSRYWVLSQPFAMFQLMQAGALLPTQVEAFEEYYPSLYEAFDAEVRAALTWRGVNDSSFVNLPPAADRGVGVFFKRKLVPFGSNVKITRPEPKAPPMPINPPKINTSLQTAGQKADGL